MLSVRERESDVGGNTGAGRAASARAPVDDAEATSLFKAVTEGDSATVQRLLAPATSSVSVNVSDSAGFTPLIIATRRGDMEMVRFLLSLPGVEVNACTLLYNSAFLYACAEGHVALAQLLLDHGADFFLPNANNDNCLLLACAAGSETTVTFLLTAYHSIQRAKATQHGGHAAGLPKRFVTLRNSEGLTALMCASMSGSVSLGKLILREARQELGVVLPASQLPANSEPNAATHFFPSVWDDQLGAIQFDSDTGYVDPAPPAFLAFVNAQNVTGDTALHIAAQGGHEQLCLLLIDTAGADPTRANRRGKLPLYLFHDAQDKEDASNDAAAVVARLSAHMDALLSYQRSCRAEYVVARASHSDKLFSELMEEEEEAQVRAARKARKQASAAPAAEKKAAKKKSKKSRASLPHSSSSNSSSGKADADAASDTSPAASPRMSSISSSAAAAVPAAPLATYATSANDSTGWEVVGEKPAKREVAPPVHKKVAQAPAPTKAKPSTSTSKPVGPAASVPPTAPSAKPAPSLPTPAAAVPASIPAAATASSAAVEPVVLAAAVAAAAAPTAAADSSAAASPVQSSPVALPYTLVPVGGSSSGNSSIAIDRPIQRAPANPAGAVPVPSSPFFAAFTTRPRAWRPITALQRRSVGPPSTDASVAEAPQASASSNGESSAEQLYELQSLLSDLHPHVESTDLQLRHVLGADWSTLSGAQLSVLDEVYAHLARQIRDAHATLVHAQQQELMSELVRTKSELHALRKEVTSLAQQHEQHE